MRTRDLAGRVAGQHVGDGPGDYPSALRDDRDGVTDLLDLAQDVTGEDDRHSGRRERPDEVAHLADSARVQAVGWLIQDEHLRLLQSGRGHREALFHAEGVRLDAVPRPVPQTYELKQLVHPALGHPGRVRQQGQGRARRELWEELGTLHECADLRHHPWQRRRYLFAENAHAALIGPNQSQQRAERRGLSRAVGAQEAVHLAGVDHHVEPVERLPRTAPQAAIGLAQAVDLNDGSQTCRTFPVGGSISLRRSRAYTREWITNHAYKP